MERLKSSLRRGFTGLLKVIEEYRWMGLVIYVFLIVVLFDLLYFRKENDWMFLLIISAGLFALNFLLMKEKFYLLLPAIGWSFFLFGAVLRKLAPLVHNLGLSTGYPLLVGWLGVLGFNAHTTGSYIDVLTGSGWLRLSMSAELFSLWHMLLATWVVFLISDKKRILFFLVRFVIGIFFMMPLLGVATVWLVRDFSDFSLILSPLILYIKLLIFLLFISYGESLHNLKEWRFNVSTLMLAAGGLCLSIAVCMAPVGKPQPFSVLIDNTHGSWEPTDRPMSTEHFGQKFTYTYSELVRLLRLYGDVEELYEGQLSKDVLDSHSIVILKTPSIPFLSSEIGSLEEFVREGGGLLVLGDHTNLVGMSTILNQVIQPYNMRFEYDDTFDPRTGGFVEWGPHLVDLTPLWSKVSNLKFETGCTISAPFSWDLITIREAASEPLRWENPGFFGDIKLDPWEYYGNFSACSLATHGKGKVIAFADSTVLSNFSIFFPGRREMLLSWIGQLSANTNNNIGKVGFFLAGLGLAIVPIRKREVNLQSLGVSLGISMLSCVIILNSYYYLIPEPEPLGMVPNIAFVGNYDLVSSSNTALSEYSPDFPDDYSTFYMASQRIGFMPIWYSDAVFDSSALGAVFVNPAVLEQERYVSVAQKYVDEGKNVLILRSEQSSEHPSYLAKEILGGAVEQLQGPVKSSSIWSAPGKAHVIIYDNREELARELMGKVTDIPQTDEQFQRYQTAFELLSSIRAEGR